MDQFKSQNEDLTGENQQLQHWVDAYQDTIRAGKQRELALSRVNGELQHDLRQDSLRFEQLQDQFDQIGHGVNYIFAADANVSELRARSAIMEGLSEGWNGFWGQSVTEKNETAVTRATAVFEAAGFENPFRNDNN